MGIFVLLPHRDIFSHSSDLWQFPEARVIQRVWRVLDHSLGRERHPTEICLQRHGDFEKKWSRISRMRFLALAKLELWNFQIIISWRGGGRDFFLILFFSGVGERH